MTPKEAAAQRIPRIRLPSWANPNAYIRLPLMANGMVGPWAELYDEWGQLACEIPIGSQRLLMLDSAFCDEEGYELYSGQPHEAEKDNYAATYTES